MPHKRKGPAGNGASCFIAFDSAQAEQLAQYMRNATPIAIPGFAPSEAVMINDRRWFKNHPGRKLRVRDPLPGEPLPPQPEIYKQGADVIVIVFKLSRYERIRSFFAASPKEHGFSDASLTAFLRTRGYGDLCEALGL
jgi:hypothetical protein